MSKLTKRFPFMKEKIELKIWHIWLWIFIISMLSEPMSHLSKCIWHINR